MDNLNAGISKLETHLCDICEIKYNNQWYVVVGINYKNVDLCEKCYNNINNIVQKQINISDDYIYCELCENFIKKETEMYSISDINICLNCVGDNNITDLFEDTNNCFETDREMYLRFKKVDLTIPNISSYQFDESNIELIDSLVRIPNIGYNAYEWRIFEDFTEVPHFDASCGFVVRCIKDNHQIASIVMDNHGRTAMNIVFENIEDYLNEKKEWENNLLYDEIDKYDKIVKENFKKFYSCDEEIIMKATKSFAVYYRLKLKLSMYYG